MQSKNAIGNLINRYKAVHKKCTLINTFGSLAVVGMLTTGGVLAMPAGEANYFKEIVAVDSSSGTPAEDTYTFSVTSKDASGADVILYFAVKDASDGVIDSTNNRTENPGAQIFDNFIGNSATYHGGAILNEGGTISSISSSSFIGNSAINNGGAIYNIGTINFIAATNQIGRLTLFSGNTDSTGSNAFIMKAQSISMPVCKMATWAL